MSEEKKPAAKAAPKQTKAMFNYTSFLMAFPVPGGGGAHVGLFRLGATGFKAGVPEPQIIADVTAKLNEYYAQRKAGRVVSDTEIEQCVHAGFLRAVEEHNGMRPVGDRKAAPKIPANTFAKIVAANKGVSAADIMAKSPVPLDFPEWEAGWRTVEALYLPDDMLYIGEFDGLTTVGKNIRPAGEWVEILKKGPPESPFIIPNPLSGLEAMKKDGSGTTLRGDRNVVKYRHLVAEMDSETMEDQLAFWSFIALPVRALTQSGGKSIHAWVDVDCENVLEWELEVEGDLFPNYLVPLGCDPACRNESRISRLPGHVRRADEKNPGNMQKLLWLSPEGKAVSD